MAIKQKRDRSIKIMMTQATFDRLTALGDTLGQSPSTLASLAVSNLINQYNATANAQTGMVDAFEKVLRQIAAENVEAVQQ